MSDFQLQKAKWQAFERFGLCRNAAFPAAGARWIRGRCADVCLSKREISTKGCKGRDVGTEVTLTTGSACQKNSEWKVSMIPYTRWPNKWATVQKNTILEFDWKNEYRWIPMCRERTMAIMAIEKLEESQETIKELLQYLSLNLQGRHGRVRRWLRSNRPMGMVPASQLFLRGEHVVGISQIFSHHFSLFCWKTCSTVVVHYRPYGLFFCVFGGRGCVTVLASPRQRTLPSWGVLRVQHHCHRLLPQLDYLGSNFPHGAFSDSRGVAGHYGSLVY